jgi:hypothetical protein
MSEYSDDLLSMLRGELRAAEQAAAESREEESGQLDNARKYQEHAEVREARAAELRQLLRQIDPEHTEQYADPAPLQGTARIAQALREMAEDLESTWSGGYRYTNITVRMLDVPDGQLLIEALPASMPGAQIRPNSGFSCVDAFEGTADGAVNREFVIQPAPAPVDVPAEARGERDDGGGDGYDMPILHAAASLEPDGTFTTSCNLRGVHPDAVVDAEQATCQPCIAIDAALGRRTEATS